MAEHGAIRVVDLLPERLALGPAVEAAMRANPEADAPGMAWGFIAEQAEKALRGLLDCDVMELLAQAWLKARALQDYADPAKHPPGETSVVHLAEHGFVREIHPVLELSVAGCPPMPVRFTLALAARFRGLALSIEDGHITAAAPGDASVSAQLKYGAIKLTDEKQSKKVKLPGRHVFAPPGLKIPPP
jgi:hypothetical protein